MLRVHVLADRVGRDHVVRALQDQRRDADAARGRRGCRTGTSTRAKRARDLRVGAAEALGQLLAQLGPVGVAHDRRRHRARPAEEVASIDSSSSSMSSRREAAGVALVVDVARRRADEHELAERAGRARGRQHADHRADGVADEDRVARGRAPRRSRRRRRRSRRARRSGRGRRREVRAAGPDVVEEHDAVVGLELRRHEAPHVLVAAETVREDDRAPVGLPADLDMVAGEDVHAPAVYARYV